jgi:hypothetical protein
MRIPSLILVLVLALAACGAPQPRAVDVDNRSDAPPDATPGRAPVSCGDATCGHDSDAPECAQRTVQVPCA